MIINSFEQFASALIEAGFSMGGENAEGIYALSARYGDGIQWHTGDPATDPWEWRMRLYEERGDIAGGKIFFRKSGWIAKEWYPYFYAVRRRGQSMREAYEDGTVSNEALRIYEAIEAHGKLAYHEIKAAAGIGAADKSRFERAVVDLQMRLFITFCGRQQKVNQRGEAYGWSSTVFTTPEAFWNFDIAAAAERISPREAEEKITERVYQLNPNADKKKIVRFIRG
jgi:hypothetical protein